MSGQAPWTAAVLALTAQLAAFLAALLAASAAHKALRWRRARAVVRQFAGVPEPLTAAALAAAVAIELSAALLLLDPGRRAAGAMLAALLWTGYLLLIVRAIAEDRRDVDCGCSFAPAARPLGAFQATRGAVLTALAGLAAWVSAAIGSVPEQGSQVLGAIALLALYGALDQVLALRPLRAGEVS
jgi:hypothetical protein